jgi:hypothetical protein
VAGIWEHFGRFEMGVIFQRAIYKSISLTSLSELSNYGMARFGHGMILYSFS